MHVVDAAAELRAGPKVVHADEQRPVFVHVAWAGGNVDRFAFSVVWEVTPPDEAAYVRPGKGQSPDDDGAGVTVRGCVAATEVAAALSRPSN